MVSGLGSFVVSRMPGILEVVEALVEHGATSDDHIKDAEDKALANTQKQVNSLSDSFDSIGEDIIGTHEDALETMEHDSKSTAETVIDVLTDPLGAVTDVAGRGVDKVKDLLGGASNTVNNTINNIDLDIRGAIGDALEEMAGSILSPIEYLFEVLLSGAYDGSLFEKLIEMFGGAIKSIIDTTIDISEDVIVDGLRTMHKAQLRVNQEIMTQAGKDGIF